MRTRSWVVLGIAVVLGVSLAAAAGVAQDVRRARGRVDAQSFAAVPSSVRASPAEWRPVEGLKLRLSCPSSRVATATASAVLGAGPAARLRVEALDPGVSRPSGAPDRVASPGAIPVPASDGRRAVSFTFGMERLPGSHGAVVRLAWRSPSGRALSMTKGSLRVLWDRSADPCR
ncbi:MAG TPA: hypothetical protein VEV43_08545 [Actinomycetota bacterium]|nr:hypothetical protein [Actinomycetota bacterium]